MATRSSGRRQASLILRRLGRRTRRPALTATKTKRRHVVDLDPATVDLLVDLAAARGCDARADAFVFSDDGGVTAWKPKPGHQGLPATPPRRWAAAVPAA